MRPEDLTKDLGLMVREAEEKASRAGEMVIGHVSRASPAQVSLESRVVSVYISFEDYLRSRGRVRVGSYLGISVPIQRVLILARVVGVERQDILSIARLPDLSGQRDPEGSVTPVLVSVEAVSERSFDGGDTLPALSPIEPQSPVFIPRASFLSEMLGLPGSGVLIGSLFESGVVRGDVGVRLDEKILRHHVLVIGTTGSGKTTLLTRIFLDPSYQSLALDIQGDYVRRLVGRGGGENYILLPLTRELVRSLCRSRACDERFYTEVLPEFYARLRGLPSPMVVGVESIADHGGVRVGFGKIESVLIPFAFRFSEIYPEANRILPLLSQQASVFFRSLAEKCVREYTQGRGLDAFINCISREGERIKLHKSTIDSIARYIIALANSEVVDVAIGRDLVGEPDYGALFRGGSKVVLDLGIARDYGSRFAPNMIAYRVLSKVFSYRDELYKSGRVSDTILLIIDEAHEFFPQSGRDFEKEPLEEMINKIMRLGRLRGLGCIMATHRPQDLNNLVIELANTKIALRSDEETLKSIGMEKYTKILETAPEGLAVIKTHGYRVPELTIRVSPPEQ
ncbi:MAG: ATP-binding protein [Sulfolobales archaeon]